VMALMLTGQSGVMRAVQICEYAVSPGNSGEAMLMGGEMSQICLSERDFMTGLP